MISMRTQICETSALTTPVSMLVSQAQKHIKGECAPQNQRQVECVGMSRSGRSMKIHAVADALGDPVHVQLLAGNMHDVTVAAELLNAIPIKDSIVLADKAYGVFGFRNTLLLIRPITASPRSHMNQSRCSATGGDTWNAISRSVFSSC